MYVCLCIHARVIDAVTQFRRDGGAHILLLLIIVVLFVVALIFSRGSARGLSWYISAKSKPPEAQRRWSHVGIQTIITCMQLEQIAKRPTYECSMHVVESVILNCTTKRGLELRNTKRT